MKKILGAVAALAVCGACSPLSLAAGKVQVGHAARVAATPTSTSLAVTCQGVKASASGFAGVVTLKAAALGAPNGPKATVTGRTDATLYLDVQGAKTGILGEIDYGGVPIVRKQIAC